MIETRVDDINLLTIGTVVECNRGWFWVYIGSRETTVKSLEHHFVRCDLIPSNQPLWSYKAVHCDTIENKFPGLLAKRARQLKS